MQFTLKLLEWAEDHVRLFQVITGLTAVLSFFLGVAWGRISSFRKWRRLREEYRNMENPGVVVTEAHVLRRQPDGSIMLDVISWGGKRTLVDLLHDPILEEKAQATARRHEGFLIMEARDQLLVMDGLQEEITGNDSSANLDVIKGRRVNTDSVIMCPVTWPGLRAATMIRNVIVDVEWMDELCDPAVIERIQATRPRYQHRNKWLHEIALRWQEEKNKSEEEACMRLVEIESQS
jgi:hypothetical protein